MYIHLVWWCIIESLWLIEEHRCSCCCWYVTKDIDTDAVDTDSFEGLLSQSSLIHLRHVTVLFYYHSIWYWCCHYCWWCYRLVGMTIIEIQVDALSHIRPAAGAAVDADSIRGSYDWLMMFIDLSEGLLLQSNVWYAKPYECAADSCYCYFFWQKDCYYCNPVCLML